MRVFSASLCFVNVKGHVNVTSGDIKLLEFKIYFCQVQFIIRLQRFFSVCCCLC